MRLILAKNNMKTLMLISFFSLNLSVSYAQIEDFSFDYNGEKIIASTFVVSANVKEVWDVYSDSDGFMTWAAPVAEIDWRRGGTIKASFN